jgi:carbamate kinase
VNEGNSALVIALGGNAISPAGEVDTIDNQFAHTSEVARRVVDLMEEGWERIVVTHGNGPQVGNVLRRVEHARDIAPWLPLDICVADTQGGMGYMIQQCLGNEVASRGIDRPVATVVTQVQVDPSDRAFDEPAKPIGPGHRLVPSPVPLRVVEAQVIAEMVTSGVVVIAGGGGGVPVVASDAGLRGVEAVVDKDLTAALIASSIGAEGLVILTDVDAAYLDFGTPQARKLMRTTSAEMRRHLADGAFPAGSMGPKVEAVSRFVEAGGSWAAIAALDDLLPATRGEAGTRVEEAS